MTKTKQTTGLTHLEQALMLLKGDCVLTSGEHQYCSSMDSIGVGAYCSIGKCSWVVLLGDKMSL